jgi:hypothetical protein
VAAMDEDRVRGQPVASMAASAAAFERAGHARLSVVAVSRGASSSGSSSPESRGSEESFEVVDDVSQGCSKNRAVRAR